MMNWTVDDTCPLYQKMLTMLTQFLFRFQVASSFLREPSTKANYTVPTIKFDNNLFLHQKQEMRSTRNTVALQISPNLLKLRAFTQPVW